MKKLFLIILLLPAFSVFGQQRIAQPKTMAEILNEKYCSALFSTPDADYFDLLDERVNASAMSYLNILDWLRGRVAGLQVYNTRSNTFIPFIRNQLASVYVDEIWVSYDYLNVLPVADIAMVKIIKGPFVGSRGGGGTIAIYTIRGDEEEPEEEK